MTTSDSNAHAPAALSVSVVLATRNRANHAFECASTVLANQGFVELIVVDQSDDDATRVALSRIDDPRLRYVPTETRGVTSARNIGIEQSNTDIVTFTDDDCRVPTNWVTTVLGVFTADPTVAMVNGRVRVPEELWAKGFTESFEPRVREWLGSYPPFGSDWGITANMSVRKDVFVKVGAFDPLLGAGSPLRSGGEPDFIFRVLRAGLKIVNATEVVVDHYGVRAFGEESSKLIRGYGFGTGAALFKHVRLRDTAAAGVYLGFLKANVLRIGTNLVRRGRPEGLGFLVGFVSGAAASFKFDIDRQQRRYIAR